jgi:hypothetical protein
MRLQTSVGGSLIFAITTKFWIFEKLIIKEQLVPLIWKKKKKKKKKKKQKKKKKKTELKNYQFLGISKTSKNYRAS